MNKQENPNKQIYNCREQSVSWKKKKKKKKVKKGTQKWGAGMALLGNMTGREVKSITADKDKRYDTDNI